VDPVNRRAFLVRGTAGAAVAAAGTAGLTSVGQPAGAAPLSEQELDALAQPVLVRIKDAAAAEVEVLVGETEVTFVDRSLVANVLRATK
jgi:hypothetical protein